MTRAGSVTKNECFGLALGEAMSYSNPCITFTIQGSGVNVVCLNNVTGLEVPYCDYIAYANAIKNLGEDKELRQQFGENGCLRVKNNFSAECFVKNVNRIMEETINE